MTNVTNELICFPFTSATNNCAEKFDHHHFPFPFHVASVTRPKRIRNSFILLASYRQLNGCLGREATLKSIKISVLGFSRKIDRDSSIDNLLIGKKKSKLKMYRATNYKKTQRSQRVDFVMVGFSESGAHLCFTH